MEIPILSGIYTDAGPDLRTAYPVNLIPVPKSSGLSNAYLRPADGLVSYGTGPGIDRGGINWNGSLYRVMGTKLVEVASNGTVTILGDVGGPTSQLVDFDYSFTQLAIASGNRLYYWDGATLTQVTDPDLGSILPTVIWIDGRFMVTDGSSLIVTDVTNPLAVDPFEYGSSEVDPDPVVSLLKLRNEAYALNRYTVEVFAGVDQEGFPFNRIAGAQIQKGTVGTFANCVFQDQIAMVGSGRNEAVGIYLAANGTTQKISTQEIDLLLLNYSEAQLAQVKVEARNDRAHAHLYVHLPDQTIVFDAQASQEVNAMIWFVLTSSLAGFSQYRARNIVWCYDRWNVGDPQSTTIGEMVDTIGSHWGQTVRWEFSTIIVYNKGFGAIFHQMELVSLTGRVAVGLNPQISTSYSKDGLTWSQDRFTSVGTVGATLKRIAWFQMGNMRNWRIQRFRGDSQAHISIARLEAQIEALAA